MPFRSSAYQLTVGSSLSGLTYLCIGVSLSQEYFVLLIRLACSISTTINVDVVSRWNNMDSVFCYYIYTFYLFIFNTTNTEISFAFWIIQRRERASRCKHTSVCFVLFGSRLQRWNDKIMWMLEYSYVYCDYLACFWCSPALFLLPFTIIQPVLWQINFTAKILCEDII